MMHTDSPLVSVASVASGEEQNAVVVRNLNFAFNFSDNLVHDFSLTLPRGSRCLLCGANGAGKTTLLQILAGKYMVGQDVVRILGRPAFHDIGLVSSGDLSYLGPQWRRDLAISGSGATLQVRQQAHEPPRRPARLAPGCAAALCSQRASPSLAGRHLRWQDDLRRGGRGPRPPRPPHLPARHRPRVAAQPRVRRAAAPRADRAGPAEALSGAAAGRDHGGHGRGGAPGPAALLRAGVRGAGGHHRVRHPHLRRPRGLAHAPGLRGGRAHGQG
jgi:energy-coupling factor transporter ATP-binding protein EcfA2